MSPGEGGPGTTVTIRGTGFRQVTQVRFAATPLASYRVVDDYTLTFTVPALPSSHDRRAVVVVSTASGSHQQPVLPFMRRPRVVALSPLAAPAGETMTLTGEDLQLAGCCIYFKSTVPGQDASAPLKWEPSTTRRTLVVPSTAASGGLRLELGQPDPTHPVTDLPSMALPFTFELVR
jgi:hypothetical protein